MISGFHFGIVSPYTLNLKSFYVFLFSIFGSPAPFFMWLRHVERAICWVSSTSLSPPAWAKVTLLRRKVGRRKYRGIPTPIFIFRKFSFSATVVLILYFICSEQMIHKTLEWSIVAVHLKTKQSKTLLSFTSRAPPRVFLKGGWQPCSSTHFPSACNMAVLRPVQMLSLGMEWWR